MTITTATWIALAVAAGTTAVRALRMRPARVRVPVRKAQQTEDDSWHPHVTTGCGR